MKEITKTTIGLYIAGLLCGIAVKLLGATNFSWLWVFILPALGCLALYAAVFAVACVFFLVGLLIQQHDKNLKDHGSI